MNGSECSNGNNTNGSKSFGSNNIKAAVPLEKQECPEDIINAFNNIKMNILIPLFKLIIEKSKEDKLKGYVNYDNISDNISDLDLIILFTSLLYNERTKKFIKIYCSQYQYINNFDIDENINNSNTINKYKYLKIFYVLKRYYYYYSGFIKLTTGNIFDYFLNIKVYYSYTEVYDIGKTIINKTESKSIYLSSKLSLDDLSSLLN